jgi:transposase
MGHTVMANSDVDGETLSDSSAGGRRLSESSERHGAGAAEAADPRGVAGWATAQDRYARSDERCSLFAAHTGCPWRYLPCNSFPPRSTVYNIFRKFQRDRLWEAIWAELHMVLRKRLGRRPVPQRQFSIANRSNQRKKVR